jgi:galactokinase
VTGLTRDARAPFTPDELRSALIEREPLATIDPDAIRIVRAPGRVNLIGEHTDYNLGYVLPAAVDLEIRIAFVPASDGRVELTSLAVGERQGFALDAIGPRRGTWIDYVAGVARVLLERCVPVRGLRGIIAATLPSAAGLASSAALELAAAFALTDPPGGRIDRLRLAQLAQRAENEYVGVNCGLMDQFAVAHGQPDQALLFDCRSLDWHPVPLPEGHRLVVCDTGSPRRLDRSAYNQRRAQCERAVAIIARRHPEVRSLRDVDEPMLTSARRQLGDEAYRRGRHVVSENRRTLACVQALAGGDLAAVGQLWAESHASLRDDYEVSSPELEAMVAVAVSTPGVRAARMTGAGFGGCVVVLADMEVVASLRERVLSEYPSMTGLAPRVFTVAAAAGVSLLPAPEAAFGLPPGR